MFELLGEALRAVVDAVSPRTAPRMDVYNQIDCSYNSHAGASSAFAHDVTKRRAMKYIIFEDFSGQAIPVLFPDRIEHGELREQLPYSTVLSAGFVHQDGKGFICHGESKALGAAAGADDAEVVSRHFQQEDD